MVCLSLANQRCGMIACQSYGACQDPAGTRGNGAVASQGRSPGQAACGGGIRPRVARVATISSNTAHRELARFRLLRLVCVQNRLRVRDEAVQLGVIGGRRRSQGIRNALARPLHVPYRWRSTRRAARTLTSSSGERRSSDTRPDGWGLRVFRQTFCSRRIGMARSVGM